MMDDKLKITASVRYDKSQNFAGNYSPRFSAVYAAGAKQNHIFRASLQTGFRNPSTQDQYIGFNIGSAVLLGSAEDNMTRFTETLPISASGQALLTALGTPASQMTINGNNAYFNSYTATSVTAFGGAITAAAPTNAAQLAAAINANSYLLKKSASGLVVPEQVKSFDIGYRSKIAGIVMDLNGYFNLYNNFIGSKYVVTPLYGTATDGGSFAPANPAYQSAFALINGDRRTFGIYTNTDIEIKSYGAGVGLSKKLTSNYEVGLNYNFVKFDYDQSKDTSFAAGFNTPQHRVKASFFGERVFGNFGFNINYRWADAYLYESPFANGMIDPSSVVDAQMNYNFPKMKSTIKVGATNLGGKDYYTVYGAGAIGKQYFVSWTINP
jgi:outer membrane cobalamin receptor